MDYIKILDQIKEIYTNGENIIQYLKNISENGGQNTLEEIMISYDFQAGTYTKNAKKNIAYNQAYTEAIAQVINGLGACDCILEAGVGEATTLSNVVKKLSNQPSKVYGFDISWSRIKYANRYAKELGLNNTFFFTGNLFCTPIANNAIDIVYTSHSIEPNGGKEKEAISELYRIAGKYLVLLEPSFELANAEAKERMLKNGYVTRIYDTVVELGYPILEYRLFDLSSNPLNPTALMIVKKDEPSCPEPQPLVCPLTKTKLIRESEVYYTSQGLLMYPVIDNIPCLLPENAIIATHFYD